MRIINKDPGWRCRSSPVESGRQGLVTAAAAAVGRRSYGWPLSRWRFSTSVVGPVIRRFGSQDRALPAGESNLDIWWIWERTEPGPANLARCAASRSG